MQCPKAVIFDLDETLAKSFQPPRAEMIERLNALIDRLPVAIMSGAGFDRIQRDVIAHLSHTNPRLALFPNSSSQCFLYENGAWKEAYSHLMTLEERDAVKAVLRQALDEMGVLRETRAYGAQIVDRESQIAFTAVGVEAPQDVKADWDPNAEKRQLIARELRDKLPQYDILIGGASTIDFTKKDMNKAFGVRWYCEYLAAKPEELLYIGDALFPGGNDEVVIPTGIQTRLVENPLATEAIIDELLAACSV